MAEHGAEPAITEQDKHGRRHRVIDKRADLIKHNGYRVSAARVKPVLQDHPAVVAAHVVGVLNPIAGEYRSMPL